MILNFQIDDSTHAGELDVETLDEIWDHLHERELPIPKFDDEIISFFRAVNGVTPANLFANGIRVNRFLNFCNDYDPKNSMIADWQIVRNRHWIADRLDPYVIPIAQLAHGDYLCLDFSKLDCTRVVRWIHEHSHPGNPRYETVATDLESFVSNPIP